MQPCHDIRRRSHKASIATTSCGNAPSSWERGHTTSESTLSSGSFPCIATATIALIVLHDGNVLLGLVNDDIVWQRHLCTHLSLWVMREHDLYHHTKDALSHQHVTNCGTDVMLLRLSSGDEISILELHCFGTLCSELATDDHFASLGTILHDEADDPIACTTHCQTPQELVTQALSLRPCAGGTVLD